MGQRCKIQCGAVISRSIFSKILTKHTHSSPVRSRYGVSFVNQKSDLVNAFVAELLYEISRFIGPRHNGTDIKVKMIKFILLCHCLYNDKSL